MTHFSVYYLFTQPRDTTSCGYRLLGELFDSLFQCAFNTDCPDSWFVDASFRDCCCDADHDPAIITTHEVLTKKMMMLQLMHTYIASSMGIVFYLYSLNDEFVEDHSSWKLGLIALIWSTRNILMSSTRMREL